MAEIYSNAQRVVIWLGEEADDSQLVFQHLKNRSRETRDRFYKGRTLAAYRKLCERPWFRITWVIQEKVLSREAIICCGSGSAPWKDLVYASSFESYTYHPLHGIEHRTRVINLGHLEAASEKGHASDACHSILSYSQSCKSTDPRDLVYGILGMLPKGLIDVDYSLEVKDVYHSFTKAVIEDGNNLSILYHYGLQRNLPGLASWVPDFTLARSSCSLPWGMGTFVDGDTHYVWLSHTFEKATPRITFRREGTELVVQGKMIDCIRLVGDEMPPCTEYAIGTRSFKRILRQWETLAATLVQRTTTASRSGSPSDWKTAASEAFLATLCTRDSLARRNDNRRLEGVLWYLRFGAGVLAKREPGYFEDVSFYLTFSDLLLVGDENESLDSRIDDLRSQAESYVRAYSRHLEKVIYGRKLFVTEKESLGLGDPPVQPGDQIVFVSGAPYPFVLRPCEHGAFYTLVGDCYLYGLDVFH